MSETARMRLSVQGHANDTVASDPEVFPSEGNLFAARVAELARTLLASADVGTGDEEQRVVVTLEWLPATRSSEVVTTVVRALDRVPAAVEQCRRHLLERLAPRWKVPTTGG